MSQISARIQKRLRSCVEHLKDEGIEAAMRGDYARAADLTLLAAMIDNACRLHQRLFPPDGAVRH